MTSLVISITPGSDLSAAETAEIIALCSLAYEEDSSVWFVTFEEPVHVIGRIDGRIVSHACWTERLLEPDGLGILRTAFVEGVATLPEAQGRGYGGQVMRALPPLVTDFDIAALSPSDPGFYARLGWELWQGDLSLRTETGLVPVPGEAAMIFRLPRTPAALDLSAALSIDGYEGETW